MLLGAPVSVDRVKFSAARSVVAGRFVNGHSETDWLLGLCTRCAACSGIYFVHSRPSRVLDHFVLRQPTVWSSPFVGSECAAVACGVIDAVMVYVVGVECNEIKGTASACLLPQGRWKHWTSLLGVYTFLAAFFLAA